MTEKKWRSCAEPALMLTFLQGKTSGRKLRLFACACARRVSALDIEEQKDAIETVERVADGLADEAELQRIMRALETFQTCRFPAFRNPLTAAKKSAAAAAELRGWRIHSELPPWTPAHIAARAAESKVQCDLVRDIAGNPFSPVTPKTSWLTSGVVSLATDLYEKNAFGFKVLRPLEQPLRDAGCDDEIVLKHCRSDGPHCRGCFVVDLLLGKS